MEIYLFYNCTILTMDSNNSEASAMAILQDKILAVGSEKEVRNRIDEFRGKNQESGEKFSLREMDLNGACIVPGFIDAHMHPGIYIFYKTQLSLSGVKGYDDLRKILGEEARKCGEGQWVVGFDLMEDTFEKPKERRFPNRYDLDEISSEHPVLVLRHDGHICAVNSLALKVIGIDKSNVAEKALEAGEIRVDENGEPTGVFTEAATAIPLEFMPLPDFQRFLDASRAFSQELASYRITTCGGVVQLGEEGPAGKAGTFEIPLIQTLIKEGLIEQDFVFYVITTQPGELKNVQKSFQELSGVEGRFQVGGIKRFADGTFGAFTAAMFDPFSDSPQKSRGFFMTDEESLFEILKETHNLGYQILIHAIGDRANRWVVDLYKRLIKTAKSKEQIRLRIEHASLLTPDIIRDAAELGLVLVCQPMFIDSEYTWLEKRLGPERIKNVYPFRSTIDASIILAGASDSPVESAKVMKALQVCVTRNGFVPEQAITITEALKMFTFNAAYALGQEKIKGSLEEGKLADFVILERNPKSVPPNQIADIKILATYHRGRKSYTPP
ncbi:MAG: amidohydrolase [Candidatus Jordarchaeum sp.]|uniref:amidohydrolase n=1 Tax=Candidatus Jordarchaeum sp. TaxID=2823881 RepID=UPI00404AF8C2